MSNSDEKFESDLINAVFAHGCIYAKRHPHYGSKSENEASWRQIASQLDKPVEECMDKWHFLFQIFRHFSRLEAKSGYDLLCSQWSHFELFKEKQSQMASSYTELIALKAGTTRYSGVELDRRAHLIQDVELRDSELMDPNTGCKRRQELWSEISEHLNRRFIHWQRCVFEWQKLWWDIKRDLQEVLRTDGRRLKDEQRELVGFFQQYKVRDPQIQAKLATNCEFDENVTESTCLRCPSTDSHLTDGICKACQACVMCSDLESTCTLTTTHWASNAKRLLPKFLRSREKISLCSPCHSTLSTQASCLWKVCRVCGVGDRPLENLMHFSYKDANKIFQTVTGYTIALRDGLPCFICIKCRDEFLDFVRFYVTFSNTQIELEHIREKYLFGKGKEDLSVYVCKMPQPNPPTQPSESLRTYSKRLRLKAEKNKYFATHDRSAESSESRGERSFEESAQPRPELMSEAKSSHTDDQDVKSFKASRPSPPPDSKAAKRAGNKRKRSKSANLGKSQAETTPTDHESTNSPVKDEKPQKPPPPQTTLSLSELSIVDLDDLDQQLHSTDRSSPSPLRKSKRFHSNEGNSVAVLTGADSNSSTCSATETSESTAAPGQGPPYVPSTFRREFQKINPKTSQNSKSSTTHATKQPKPPQSQPIVDAKQTREYRKRPTSLHLKGIIKRPVVETTSVKADTPAENPDMSSKGLTRKVKGAISSLEQSPFSLPNTPKNVNNSVYLKAITELTPSLEQSPMASSTPCSRVPRSSEESVIPPPKPSISLIRLSGVNSSSEKPEPSSKPTTTMTITRSDKPDAPPSKSTTTVIRSLEQLPVASATVTRSSEESVNLSSKPTTSLTRSSEESVNPTPKLTTTMTITRCSEESVNPSPKPCLNVRRPSEPCVVLPVKLTTGMYESSEQLQEASAKPSTTVTVTRSLEQSVNPSPKPCTNVRRPPEPCVVIPVKHTTGLNGSPEQLKVASSKPSISVTVTRSLDQFGKPSLKVTSSLGKSSEEYVNPTTEPTTTMTVTRSSEQSVNPRRPSVPPVKPITGLNGSSEHPQVASSKSSITVIRTSEQSAIPSSKPTTTMTVIRSSHQSTNSSPEPSINSIRLANDCTIRPVKPTTATNCSSDKPETPSSTPPTTTVTMTASSEHSGSKPTTSVGRSELPSINVIRLPDQSHVATGTTRSSEQPQASSKPSTRSATSADQSNLPSLKAITRSVLGGRKLLGEMLISCVMDEPASPAEVEEVSSEMEEKEAASEETPNPAISTRADIAQERHTTPTELDTIIIGDDSPLAGPPPVEGLSNPFMFLPDIVQSTELRLHTDIALHRTLLADDEDEEDDDVADVYVIEDEPVNEDKTDDITHVQQASLINSVIDRSFRATESRFWQTDDVFSLSRNNDRVDQDRAADP